MVRYPKYNGGPQARLDTVTLRQIPEAGSRVVSLQNGETHVLWQVDFAVFDQLKKTPGVNVGEVTTESWDPLVMDVRKPPLSDRRVRQAIRYAIDKDRLLQLALYGHGVKVPFPLSPQNPHFPADAPIVPFDIAKAKQLLSEAGYPNGFETPLFLGIGRPIRVAEGIAIAEMLKAVNIRCNIQQMPLDKFFADIEFNGTFYTDGWSAESATDSQVYPKFHTDGGWNVAHWSNAKADQLLDQARKTSSDAERRRLYGEVARVANEDGPYMYAWVANRADAWRTDVQGYAPHPLNYIYARDLSLKS
jgi:peptide/nickel transport system substrate-binding protein